MAPQPDPLNQLSNVNVQAIDSFTYIKFDRKVDYSINLSECTYVVVASGLLNTENQVAKHTHSPRYSSDCFFIARQVSTITTTSTESSTTVESSTTSQINVESSTTESQTISPETNYESSTTTESDSLLIYKLEMSLNITFNSELNIEGSDSYIALTKSIKSFCLDAATAGGLTGLEDYRVNSYTPGSVLVDWYLGFRLMSTDPITDQNDIQKAFNHYSNSNSLELRINYIRITFYQAVIEPTTTESSSSTTTESSSTTTTESISTSTIERSSTTTIESSSSTTTESSSSTTTESISTSTTESSSTTANGQIQFRLKLRILTEYDAELADSNSDKYRDLSNQIDKNFNNAFIVSGINSFIEFKVLSFTSGSILVDSVLTFYQIPSYSTIFKNSLIASISSFVLTNGSTNYASDSIEITDYPLETSTVFSTTNDYLTKFTSTTKWSEQSSTSTLEPTTINSKTTSLDSIKFINKGSFMNTTELKLTMKIKSDFKPSLNDQTSDDFKAFLKIFTEELTVQKSTPLSITLAMRWTVITFKTGRETYRLFLYYNEIYKLKIKSAMKNTKEYQSVKINLLKPGSIIVDSTLMFSKAQTPNSLQTTLKEFFIQRLSKLNVDTDSIALTETNPPPYSSPDSSSNDGAIAAAIVVPLGVFFIILCIGCFVLFKRYKKKKSAKKTVKADDTKFRSPLDPTSFMAIKKNTEAKFKPIKDTVDNVNEDTKSVKSMNKSPDNRTESYSKRLDDTEMNNLNKLNLSASNQTLNESKIEFENDKELRSLQEKEYDVAEHSLISDKKAETKLSREELKVETLSENSDEVTREEEQAKMEELDEMEDSNASVNDVLCLKESLTSQSKLADETAVKLNSNQLVDDNISSDSETENNQSDDDDDNNDDSKTIHI